MYSVCLFCHSSLGGNEVFETFPVGRRLAYDPARGRLWVVCPECARWNLSPLEERWEAIEQAERLHARTKFKVGSESMSLARLAPGTEVVRIGGPTPTEFAVWRYGDTFHRRRVRNIGLAGTAVGAGVIASMGMLAAGGIALLAAAQLALTINDFARFGLGTRTVTRIRTAASVLSVTGTQLRWTYLGQDGDGRLLLQIGPSTGGMREPLLLTGDDAVAALRKVLPAVNRMGGTRTEIERALTRVAAAGTSARMIDAIACRGAQLTRRDDDRGFFGQLLDHALSRRTGLTAIPPAMSLALEMALNEDVERRAFEGELTELEASWREAEEIARIADDMFLPDAVTSKLAQMAQQAGASGDRGRPDASRPCPDAVPDGGLA